MTILLNTYITIILQINNSLTSYTSKFIEIVKQVVFVKCLGHKHKFMNINLSKFCDSKVHDNFIFNALVINSSHIAVTWMDGDKLSTFLDNEAGIAVYFFLTHLEAGYFKQFLYSKNIFTREIIASCYRKQPDLFIAWKWH